MIEYLPCRESFCIHKFCLRFFVWLKCVYAHTNWKWFTYRLFCVLCTSIISSQSNFVYWPESFIVAVHRVSLVNQIEMSEMKQQLIVAHRNILSLSFYLEFFYRRIQLRIHWTISSINNVNAASFSYMCSTHTTELCCTKGSIVAEMHTELKAMWRVNWMI